MLATEVDDLFEDGSDAWSVGLPVSYPLFTAGRLRSQVDGAEALAEELELVYRQTLLIAQEEVENALVAYTNDRRRLATLERVVDAARRTVSLSRELYTSGQSDFQNVLDAQRSQFGFEDEREQVRLSILLDLVDLYRALGGGWGRPIL